MGAGAAVGVAPGDEAGSAEAVTLFVVDAVLEARVGRGSAAGGGGVVAGVGSGVAVGGAAFLAMVWMGAPRTSVGEGDDAAEGDRSQPAPSTANMTATVPAATAPNLKPDARILIN